VNRRIIGYHLDDEGHWVADLACGHRQHVRHDPPMQSRPWVTTAQGRAAHLGTELDCVRCDGPSSVSGDVPIVAIEENGTEVREAVLKGLIAYNREHAEAPDFHPLVLSARSSSGEIIGGLAGQTGWRWLQVDLLWVASPFRRQGVGRRLLRVAEGEAARRGCLHAHLDTFDFQARRFYEREGYIVFGVQADYPPGHQRFYFRKALKAPVGSDVGP
jgi:GNAT superfamily N-acetyltransferase